ncbi:hypothetical protein L6452_06981 [Arctium lappa]|uniref:Uncharacterized protein n=1 Tax=Arctium lappa TaxID=4217 RepID=A0ACB9EKZ2_ARCLA|nr:hypothetical protein L6452_06981 [Arctium lappa]
MTIGYLLANNYKLSLLVVSKVEHWLLITEFLHPKGLLRVRIKRGVNLAIRDINTSDPYIVIRMGKQN